MKSYVGKLKNKQFEYQRHCKKYLPFFGFKQFSRFLNYLFSLNTPPDIHALVHLSNSGQQEQPKHKIPSVMSLNFLLWGFFKFPLCGSNLFLHTNKTPLQLSWEVPFILLPIHCMSVVKTFVLMPFSFFRTLICQLSLKNH